MSAASAKKSNKKSKKTTSSGMKLGDALGAIKNSTSKREIAFEDVIRALSHRGFGALLIAPALIAMLPTGALPGVPAVCAIFIILIAGQLVMNCSHPWLPRKIREISFSRAKYVKAVDKAEPFIRRVDKFFHPRLEILTGDTAQRITAVVCIILAIGMIMIGFIPFTVMFLAAPILLFGVALSVHDGLLMLISIAYMLCGAAFIVMLL